METVKTRIKRHSKYMWTVHIASYSLGPTERALHAKDKQKKLREEVIETAGTE